MMYKQMAVQEFLRNGGTLADLLSRYAIKTKRHRGIPHLVLLKYRLGAVSCILGKQFGLAVAARQ